MRQRMVVQYQTDAEGQRTLNLFHGAKEVSFDEPHLFGFGEALAQQTTFVASEAMTWGSGQPWNEVQGLLETLIEEGVLEPAADDGAPWPSTSDRSRPSLLPTAQIDAPQDWSDCAAVTERLTGRAVELGYLELIVPVFRVAHVYLDGDGRQVGEANVFPRALRLDIPTDWLACIYPGTRYLAERPMNVTALKAMRTHWPQMMAALRHIRAHFVTRFRAGDEGWTIGEIERLATLVLAVPTYQLMRCDRPIGNGTLHPALSSLFRVTDGLRMTMHQMLFVPVGEPARAPDARISSAEIHDYAERNYSFHSETGVCAGPRHMVQEFLRILVDGAGEAEPFAFDPEVDAALQDIDKAFDYGLAGLQGHAAVFSIWPAMARTYERLAQIADDAVQQDIDGIAAFAGLLQQRLDAVRTGTFLATEAWRADREAVYADMYQAAGAGLRPAAMEPGLTARLARRPTTSHLVAYQALRTMLMQRFGDVAGVHAGRMAACLVDFLVRLQATLVLGEDSQARVNSLLGRPAPTQPFTSAALDVHNLLLDSAARRLPFLLDDLAEALGIAISVDRHGIQVVDAGSAGLNPLTHSVDMVSTEPRAEQRNLRRA